MLQGTFKRTLLCCLLGASLGVQAKIDEVHFLIPGGAGGGWDMTCRLVGKTLQDLNITRFDAALDLTAPERPSFLADACPDNPSLLEQVSQLLATHERAANFLAPSDATPTAASGASITENAAPSGRCAGSPIQKNGTDAPSLRRAATAVSGPIPAGSPQVRAMGLTGALTARG